MMNSVNLKNESRFKKKWIEWIEKKKHNAKFDYWVPRHWVAHIEGNLDSKIEQKKRKSCVSWYVVLGHKKSTLLIIIRFHTRYLGLKNSIKNPSWLNKKNNIYITTRMGKT